MSESNAEQKNKVPLTIITGFLGSGKTTLINYILSENHGKKIAVIENEFGKEIQIEGAMMVKDENLEQEWVEMPNGCICCAVKDDLLVTVETLISKKKGNLDYIFIEPSGLADPGALASIFWVDQDVDTNVYLDGIVTIVDAKHISLHLDDKEVENGGANEAHKQIAFGDRIIINKKDLVTDEQLEQLKSRIKSVNRNSQIIVTERSRIDLDQILGIKAFDMKEAMELDLKLNPQQCCDHSGEHDHHHNHNEGRHDNSVVTVFIEEKREVDLQKFKLWLGELLWQPEGSSITIFRCKGQLNVEGEDERYVLQGVHELFDLDQSGVLWGETRENRLLFIGRGIEQNSLQKDFTEKCLAD